MRPVRPFFVSGAFLGLSALLLGVGGCNSGSSTGPSGQPSYSLSATPLNCFPCNTFIGQRTPKQFSASGLAGFV